MIKQFFLYLDNHRNMINDKMVDMKELAFRLERGDDLKKNIEERCKDCTAIILCGVGCVYHFKLRMAEATSYMEREENCEIVSLTGTVCRGKAHIHMSLSEDSGNCLGGHMEYGCLINTTCEVVLGILEEYDAKRSFDEKTGYDEIAFVRK